MLGANNQQTTAVALSILTEGCYTELTKFRIDGYDSRYGAACLTTVVSQ